MIRAAHEEIAEAVVDLLLRRQIGQSGQQRVLDRPAVLRAVRAHAEVLLIIRGRDLGAVRQGIAAGGGMQHLARQHIDPARLVVHRDARHIRGQDLGALHARDDLHEGARRIEERHVARQRAVPGHAAAEIVQTADVGVQRVDLPTLLVDQLCAHAQAARGVNTLTQRVQIRIGRGQTLRAVRGKQTVEGALPHDRAAAVKGQDLVIDIIGQEIHLSEGMSSKIIG